MDDRDKIQALLLNATIILNQLEELGEDPHMIDGDSVIYCTSGRVVWDHGTKSWVLETP